MYLNKVFLYGRLTRDIELKATAGGTNVASISIATNRSFKGKEGTQQEQTEYHNVIAFGRTADVMAQYLKKGRSVFVEGRLQTRSWETEGKKNYRTEIIVENFQFGEGGERADRAPEPEEHPLEKAFDKTPVEGREYSSSLGNENYPSEINPEDIPF